MTLLMRVGAALALTGLGLELAVSSYRAAPAPDGKRLYMKRCVMCHGRDGKGFKAIKSQDFTDPRWQAALKDEQLAEVIKNGKKESHMLAFGDKLSDDEIAAIVAHIRTFNSAKK